MTMKFKKVISIVLAVLMTFSVFSVATFAEETAAAKAVADS